MKLATVEIITVGNELLDSTTLNTNSHWLARQVTRLGGAVSRITVVGDDLGAIAGVFQEALQRQPKWILCCGGLGPTFDDMTLEGVAKALRVPLQLDRRALAMLRQRYEQLVQQGVLQEVKWTPQRRKMALLPKGSRPLKNPVGSAPAALITWQSTELVCLPGVPKEMRAIFKESVAPLLMRDTVGVYRREARVQVSAILESNLAPLLADVMAGHQGVYIKSHPMGMENGVAHIQIQVISTGTSPEGTESSVQWALRKLTRLIEREGGAVTPQTG